jgi:hypothetical protein
MKAALGHRGIDTPAPKDRPWFQAAAGVPVIDAARDGSAPRAKPARTPRLAEYPLGRRRDSRVAQAALARSRAPASGSARRSLLAGAFADDGRRMV